MVTTQHFARIFLMAFATLLTAAMLPSSTRGEPFIRGDLDGSGNLQLVDAVSLFGFIFLNDPPTIGCKDTADGNDDGRVNIADGTFILNFVFLGGEPPPPPGFECATGLGPTCAETGFFQPGYDLTPDDPFSCGDTVVVGGDRPVAVHVPPSYDPAAPMPLVLLLHGYTRSGGWLESYRQIRPLADSRGFLYAYPNGTRDGSGDRFWNATDACCDFGALSVDDSGYLRGVIEEIRSQLNVDPHRIFLAGDSNGGFMSHRMACEHSDTIAAIAAVAGVTFLDPDRCSPGVPVNILQIHGTADGLISYTGGCLARGAWCHPSAEETVKRWAELNGCSTTSELGQPLDLEAHLASEETEIVRWRSDCKVGSTVELWRVLGGSHHLGILEPFDAVPRIGNPKFSEAIIDWLLAHPKKLLASFTVAPGSAPHEVCVDASESSALEGTAIHSYDWDFGDGVTDQGSELCHIYPFAAPFRVRFRVTNDLGDELSLKRIVELPFEAGDVTPWASADIGEPAAVGGARFENGSLFVRAGGAEFQARNDEFQFVYQELTGDVAITAKISALFPQDGVSSAGLMFREGLEVSSSLVSILLSNSGETHHMEFVRRKLLARIETSSDLEDRWARIERRGNEFIGLHSADGETWSELDRATIDMPATIFCGVAVTALENEDNETVVSKIDELEVTEL